MQSWNTCLALWVTGPLRHCLIHQGIVHFPGGNAYSIFADMSLSTITERAG